MTDDLPLFNQPPDPAARERADLGVARSADRAERAEPGWIETATEALRRLALVTEPDVLFTIEQARTVIAEAGELTQPPNLRAWGQVTRRARRLGYIEQVPGRFAPAASSNCSPKPLYRRGPSSCLAPSVKRSDAA